MSIKVFPAVVALLALTACGSLDTATRNAPATDPVLTLGAEAPAWHGSVYALNELTVLVPETLVVSEANSLLPKADIVWRGDGPGDRYEQVRAIFESAAGSADLGAGQKVNATVEVLRFHGLTEKARYVTGGNYAIRFRLTLTDPATGAQIAPPRIVKADMPMWGSAREALSDPELGGEKAIVTRFLAKELGLALGHQV